MSTQRREEILSQVLTILETLQGSGEDDLKTVVRNRGLLDNDARPAAILLDGDETAAGAPSVGRGRRVMQPVIVKMTPQVYVILKIKKPDNAGIGELLNAYRVRVVQALANDSTLATLVGTSGDISYEGCETDLKSGMTVEGQMRLDFAIRTVVNPYDN